MPLFSAEVEATAKVIAYIEVDADNEADARSAAKEAAEDGHGVAWSFNGFKNNSRPGVKVTWICKEDEE